MAHPVEQHVPAFAFGGLVEALVARIRSAYARQSAYWRTYNELSKLTDRELNDIGVSRCMIEAIAQGEADRC